MTSIQQACRVKTATTLFRLDYRRPAPRVLETPDDIAYAWLKARCALCGACPDMLRWFGLTRADARLAASRAGPRLRLVV